MMLATLQGGSSISGDVKYKADGDDSAAALCRRGLSVALENSGHARHETRGDTRWEGEVE
jgi:hypothetical protein